MSMMDKVYEFSTIPLRSILGRIDPKNDTVGSLMQRSGKSKTWVTEGLRYLGYTVHKDGSITKQ